jgi:hypothetical protein
MLERVKKFIGRYRHWLVGAGFLMVLYMYQERPFDKAEAATADSAKSLKDTIVGTWKMGNMQNTIGGSAPRITRTKAGVGTFEIRQDGSYVKKSKTGTINGSWGLSKADFSDPGLDAVFRKGKRLGEVETIQFHGGEATCHVVSSSATQIVCEGTTDVGGWRWSLNRVGGTK